MHGDITTTGCNGNLTILEKIWEQEAHNRMPEWIENTK